VFELKKVNSYDSEHQNYGGSSYSGSPSTFQPKRESNQPPLWWAQNYTWNGCLSQWEMLLHGGCVSWWLTNPLIMVHLNSRVKGSGPCGIRLLRRSSKSQGCKQPSSSLWQGGWYYGTQHVGAVLLTTYLKPFRYYKRFYHKGMFAERIHPGGVDKWCVGDGIWYN